MIRVYRFGDKVAINPPDGPTFYVSRDAAKEMARVMDCLGWDIQDRGFTKSTWGTTEIEEKS